MAAVMGIYGIVCGLMFMCIHLNSLRSFGVPYMEPFRQGNGQKPW